ncbi:MAG: hypothetical protein FIB01_03715 [Gemmatimonadetes bacterium]|nr:hypothetical protein [Gemmatimonadota bacterium]
MAERGGERAGGFGRPRRILELTALALSILAAGCYSYTQVSPSAVPAGSHVRLRVDPKVPLKVGEVPLPDGGRSIRGMLLPESSADTLLCSVALSSGDPLMPTRGLRGTVSVPVAELERLEVRHFQKGRTAAVVGTGALLGLVLLNWAFDVSNPNTVGDDGGGGPNNARIPLFRLRW